MWSRLATVLAVVLVGALILSACSTARQPTATPTATPPSMETVVPTPTAQLGPEELSPVNPPGVADLAVEIPERIEIVPGRTTVYTVTLRNDGPDLAAGIVLSGVLPNGVTAQWARPAQAACQQAESSVDCDLGALIVGSAATVTLDLSGTGVEPGLTDARGDGAGQDLPWLTCSADQAAAPPHFTCLLSRLQPGSEVQVRVGLDATGPLTGTRRHTATVTANAVDPAPENNQGASTLVPGPARTPEVGSLPALPDLVVQGDGPASVVTGQPFTYTYTITNRGASDATRVWFQDEIPSDTDLIAYAPQPPRCEQQGDALTCQLEAPGGSESVTFTLEITGYGGQPLAIELDPLLPGWPACFVIKEQTWQHFLVCEIGVLRPGQTTEVRLVLTAIGSQPRTTSNTASVHLAEQDPAPLDNTSTTTITIRAGGED
ncbi:MAG: DUF11 domain-containing protein [Anaerolineae bacterium]|nr:DUF11 domain-containing protein [Anaerolineae bacterium]